MNQVILIGRFTRDPDVRYTNDGMAVCRFSLAVDRRTQKDGTRETDFISCVAFKNQAEFIGKYFFKGSKAAVIGRIQTGNYTDKDGKKVYTTDVLIHEIEFADSKKNNESNEPVVNDGFMNIPEGIEDDGLPFN